MTHEEGATVAYSFWEDGSDSDLSSMPPSRSPTPRLSPPPCSRYPSPPTSLSSIPGTPCSQMIDSCTTSQTERDGPPPLKRRKLSEKMPRDTKRLDLSQYREQPDAEQAVQLGRLLKAIRTKRKIVVVAGAGISVSAGIPDFRSSTGLFNTLKSQHNLKGSGKDLFDAAVYRDQSSIASFHEMVRSLSVATKSATPTLFHHMLARLAHDGRLLRLYTQNVDGIDTSIEPLATATPLPIKGPWPKTVQLHGGLEKMICTKCHELSNFDAELFDGPSPPECQSCLVLDQVRTQNAGKRSHGVGRLRPRMVLYNEHNPDDEAIGAVARADLRVRPDAVIVVGTTLKVPGIRRIVREMCGVVRGRRDGLAVWINKDPEPSGKEFENCWDLIVSGDSDEVADYAKLRNWDDQSIDEWAHVTGEEIQQVKDRGSPQVIVEPELKTAIATMPTPQASPRIPQLEVFNAMSLGLPTVEFEPKKKPARTALSIKDMLNPASNGTSEKGSKKVARAKPKVPRKSARATVTTKAPAQAANGTLTFKVSKPSASNGGQYPVKIDSPADIELSAEVLEAPLLQWPLKNEASEAAVSPDTGTSVMIVKETMRKTNDTTIKVAPRKNSTPMTSISPSAARNNTCPPHSPPMKSSGIRLKLDLKAARATSS